MIVAALCLAPSKSVPMVEVSALQVVAGSGVVRDHFFGSKQRHPGQNLTLIEAEEIEAFGARTGKKIALTDPRRNVVTRGIRLNALVGKVFTIGDVTLRGVELCEPCGRLARYLAGPTMTKTEFISEFAGRCGLRADVVTSGALRVGDPVLLPG